MNYKKQLEDEKWQVKRRKILQRDGFKCTQCGYEDNLHVHHLYYVYFRKAWQYPHNALITLCGKCHSKWHEEHELEFRDSIYSKPNKQYSAPKKNKKSKSQKRKDRFLKLETQKKKLIAIAEALGLDGCSKDVLEIIGNNKYNVAANLIRNLKNVQTKKLPADSTVV